MHQHLRQVTKVVRSGNSSPSDASSTSDQRDLPPSRTRSSLDLTQYTERAGPANPDSRDARPVERASNMAQQEREQTKLNQIIQNFHTKAALTICSSRAHLPQVYNKAGDLKQNRWFNLILDETDVLLDDLQEWRRPDLAENRPLPLVIDVFADTTSLTPGQALVITDTNKKRWNCAEALDVNSNNGAPQVLLERWTIQLGNADGYTSTQLNDQLPNVYKKGVVLFRSLYSFLRLLPTWKLHRRLGRQTGTTNSFRLKYRIRRGPQGRASTSRLSKENAFAPLCPTDVEAESITSSHTYESLLCPAGPLSIGVQYRINVDLSVADSEALLSSRFAGLDASLQDRSLYTGRSLPGQRSSGEVAYGSSVDKSRATDSSRLSRVAGGGAYGSLGTFHAAGKRESPVTVLRQRALSQDQDVDVLRSGSLSRRASQAGDSSLLRNPPFKAGSYASSPRGLASPSTSAPRPSTLGTSAPKRLSLNTLPQQALRAPGSFPDQAIASSGSASPRPAPMHRYSSSFANRKRFTSQSSGGKAGESATSSGRGSESSKERSGQLEEPNAESSGGSGRTDEDDIAAFISTVEQAKNLGSFQNRKRPGSTTINLTKFKGLGITSAELADEMSSSSLIQTSLTPPSRRLSNVPGLSTSSSPGRAYTHTPHVRSRLSTHSIAEVRESEASSSKEQPEREQDNESSDEEPFIFQQDNII